METWTLIFILATDFGPTSQTVPGIPTRAECEQAAKAIEGGIIQAKARWVCVRSREILQPTPRIEK